MVPRLDRRYLAPLMIATLWISVAAMAAENEPRPEQVQQAEMRIPPIAGPASIPAARQVAAAQPLATQGGAIELGADPDPDRFDKADVERWWQWYEHRRKAE